MFKKILLTLAFLLVIPVATHAAAGENVYGFAWSMNTGWIKLNDCVISGTTEKTCDSEPQPAPNQPFRIDNGYTIKPNNSLASPSPAYGVNIDNGDFEGYGWSSNVGWVDFSGGNCGTGAQATFANDGSATISGWIQVVSASQAGNNSGGWNGCIKMSGPITGGGNYGVTIAPSGGTNQQFSGYAWNANSASTPAGFDPLVGESWVSFSGAYYVNELATIDLSIDHWSTTCTQTNNEINLTWATTGITSGTCSWTNTLSGSAANNGNNQQFNLGNSQSNYNITLSCNSPSGTVTDTVSVSCIPVPECSDDIDNDSSQGTDSADPSCHMPCPSPNNQYMPSWNNESKVFTQLEILNLCSGTPSPSTAPKYEER